MIFNTGSTVDCPPASTIDRQVFAPSPSLLFLFRYCPYSMDDFVEEAGITPLKRQSPQTNAFRARGIGLER